MKKKLLIYAHYFYPDVASTGQILTELTEGMRETIFLDESSRMAFWMAIYRKNKPLTLLWPINREDWL